MTSNEKVEGVVRNVMKVILSQSTDMAIINELGSLKDYLSSKWHNDRKDIPSFAHLSRTEMRKAQSLLKKELKKSAENKENTFLVTMRIIEALGCLMEDVTKIKKSNKKLIFCINIWMANIYEELETISLLDEI